MIFGTIKVYSQQWDGPTNKDSAILRRGGVTIGLDSFRYKGPNIIHLAKQVIVRSKATGDIFDVLNEQENIVDGGDVIWGAVTNYQPGDVGLLTLSSPLTPNTGAQTRFTVRANGNVGIGVRNPAERLDVDGAIHAREIKVNVDNWPDYVFDSCYSVISIDSLENFICTNQHLPDIPSSNDMKSTGLQLASMTTKVIKKIEELSLYIISQNKEILEMKESIKYQQREIERLKKQLTYIY